MNQSSTLSNTERKTSASSGCGCGCGDVCHCGQSADATCGCQEGLLVQPHFFAGQLLTDEDLQALTNYVLTKHRLHNRYITGSGVACGLAVTCHPCDPGKVIVEPGYAVDCCGNDIHVPCPVELDINAMVRDLKFKRLGRDCGDPCDPKNNGKQKKGDPCAEIAERYCLYINYCEQPTDLVTPYVQDDSCTAGCQPTRLREGFRFELRCRDEDECPLGILERLRCCLGDAKETEHIAGEFNRLKSFWKNSRAALDASNAEKVPPLTEGDFVLMADSYKALQKTQEKLPGGGSGKTLHKRQTQTPGEPPPEAEPCGEPEPEPAPEPTPAALSEDELRTALDNVQTLGAGLVRMRLESIGQEQQKTILADSGDDSAPFSRDEATALLKEITPALVKPAKETLKSQIELQAAEAILTSTEKYTAPDFDPKKISAKRLYPYLLKVPANKKFTQSAHDILARIKDLLLRQMGKCPPSTKCCLMEEVCAIVVPTGDDLNEQSIAALEALFRAFMRYLIDCFCAALIPPCPTCEDPAVKLACLEVKECKVDNICNLERTFLLTENNFRHWLPFLCSIGEFFERLCCTCPTKVFDRPSPRQDDVPVLHGTFHELGSQKAFDQTSGPLPDILTFVSVSKEAAQPAFDLAGHLKAMLKPFLDCVLQRETFKPIKDRPAFMGTIIDKPAPTIGPATYPAAFKEEFQTVIGKVEKTFENKLSASKGAHTKEINDLKTMVKTLKEANKDLAKRLATIEKGPKK